MRYQAKPTDTAKKLFIDLMNHYRFRVDREIDYGFRTVTNLRTTYFYNDKRLEHARELLWKNLPHPGHPVCNYWDINIECPIIDGIEIPKTLPELIETGNQLSTMVMVAGIPYRTDIPKYMDEKEEDGGIFIIYRQNIGMNVLMPLQWTMTFILSALGVANEELRNQAIHRERAASLMR